MKVLFGNGCSNTRVIGEAETTDEAFAIVNKFMEDRNYKSYYQRCWFIPDIGMTKVDVGSHTQFFYIDEDIMDSLKTKED